MKMTVIMIYLIIHFSNISINLSIINLPTPVPVKADQHHSLHKSNSPVHYSLALPVDTPGVCVHMEGPAPDNQELEHQTGQVSDYRDGIVCGIY
jgi:hypothetical protein